MTGETHGSNWLRSLRDKPVIGDIAVTRVTLTNPDSHREPCDFSPDSASKKSDPCCISFVHLSAFRYFIKKFK